MRAPKYCLVERVKRGEMETVRGQTQHDAFEMSVNDLLNKTRDKAGHLAHESFPPTNALKIMDQSGAKGNATNTAQVAGMVGDSKIWPASAFLCFSTTALGRSRTALPAILTISKDAVSSAIRPTMVFDRSSFLARNRWPRGYHRHGREDE